jgi:hypothetical protein
MLTLFNADRQLSRLAADAAHIARITRASEQPWRGRLIDHSPHGARPGIQRGPDALGHQLDRARIEQLIEVAVVGDANRLRDVLTADAVGWSPTLTFNSRAEAESALRECHSCLSIRAFKVDQAWWSASNVFAEWSAEVVSTGPLLVGDDVLVETADRRVHLVGASLVYLLGDRISEIHTYFDDAAVIEQLLLDDTTS